MTEPRQNRRCHANPARTVRSGFPSPRTGFTLIELLITLALMIVIATMYYGFGSQSHQRRQKMRCQQNLQKMYLALEIYAAEHRGVFPDSLDADTSEEALDVLVPRYTADTSIFICPGSKDSMLPASESFRKRQISYAYYMGHRAADGSAVLVSDEQINTESKQADQEVFSSTGEPPGNNHHKYGGNFLFCDGRVESSNTRAPVGLALPPGVRLLNPKP